MERLLRVRWELDNENIQTEKIIPRYHKVFLIGKNSILIWNLSMAQPPVILSVIKLGLILLRFQNREEVLTIAFTLSLLNKLISLILIPCSIESIDYLDCLPLSYELLMFID